ncbi:MULTISPECIES: hypothetical protein [Mycolicibacterium]|uniref:hypothetical protein n=1 Tax=Mycolicibacterium TaxID=1866885 RepID=UPI0007E945C7|nr:hypothetical protein [Mycolicibacterium fortuitum]OBG09403.1 hypothetical protein A5768_15350 [Mycolicibacterium fortuitum]
MPIEPLPESVRDRLAQFLREWASRIREEGWDDYEQVLSTGEVLGVRAVLDPAAVDAAVEQWAATLWGTIGAEADAAADYPRTRAWFAAIREPEIEELTDTEKARYEAARSASTDLRAALDSGDADEKHAAFGQLMQTLSAMDPETTRDKLHVPDDAGEHRDGLIAIMRRIPPNWGRWISCDRGWYPIICELDAALAELDPAYEVHQVKEKFAGLRFYYRASDQAHADAMHALVREAETRCAATCEMCGQPGTPHTNSRYWMKTLCPSCATTQGYSPIGELVNDLTADMAGVWSVACYGDNDESIWDLTHGEVTVNGERHRDVTVLALPSVLRTWRVRLADGSEIESGLIGRIERIR